MAFKVVVSDTVVTKVKGVYLDKSDVMPFELELTQDRVSQDVMEGVIADKTESTTAFLKRVTKGWGKQRLVLNDDDTPAAFSPEAFALLLNIYGMSNYCWMAYLRQAGVHEKN